LIYSLFRWQSRFFQIKNGQLVWFKKKDKSMAHNFLNIKEIKKVISIEDLKFNIISNIKNYEFLVETKEKRDEWINIINQEIKNLSKKQEKKYNNIYELDLKKKIFQDFSNLSAIDTNKTYMKNVIDASMKKENFFKSKKET